jgi:hypothetical protein
LVPEEVTTRTDIVAVGASEEDYGLHAITESGELLRWFPYDDAPVVPLRLPEELEGPFARTISETCAVDNEGQLWLLLDDDVVRSPAASTDNVHCGRETMFGLDQSGLPFLVDRQRGIVAFPEALRALFSGASLEPTMDSRVPGVVVRKHDGGAILVTEAVATAIAQGRGLWPVD